MLERHGLVITVVTVASIAVVGYMYSQNYISFQGGLHIVKPSKTPVNIEKSIEMEKPEPANVQPINRDTNLVSKVHAVIPSSESTKVVEEPRLFDDIMKAVETFSPLMAPYITFYLFKKKKKKTKTDEDE